MDSDRLDQLFDRYFDNELGPEEQAELVALLSDPESQKYWRALASLEGRLQEEFLTAGAEACPAPESRRSGRRFRSHRLNRIPSAWIPAFAAAGLAGIFILLALFSSERNRPETTRQEEPPPRVQKRLADAQAEARNAEKDIAEIERERERLVQALKQAEQDRQEEVRRKAEEDLKRNEERRRQEMARLEKAREDARKAEEELARHRSPPPPQKPVPSETEAAVAEIERVDGDVAVLAEGRRTPAVEKSPLLAGQGLITAAGSRVAFTYPDKTRVELGAQTTVREIFDARPRSRGKRFLIDQGTVRAEVSRQPPEQPMVLTTPQAEVGVVGTSLKLAVDPASTRLEVKEGNVRLKRLRDGKSVDVSSGHYAVAAAGVELVAKALPIDEILLRPQQGRIFGKNWRLVKDAQASTGEALEALQDGEGPARAAQRSGWPYVLFTFQADADRDYFVWARGACMATADRKQYDGIVLEPAAGQFSRKCRFFGRVAEGLYSLNAYGERDGYWWVGDNNATDAPVSIRFSRPGRQALKLYAWESPMRVDVIWLSTTQKTRPDPRQAGPDAERK